jgi:type VI protein secretion system component VasK
VRVLGLAGVVLALAILGYLILEYLNEAGTAQEALRSLPPTGSAPPADVSRRGLEQRLSPILDRERQRVEETDRAAGQ